MSDQKLKFVQIVERAAKEELAGLEWSVWFDIDLVSGDTVVGCNVYGRDMQRHRYSMVVPEHERDSDEAKTKLVEAMRNLRAKL